MGICVRFFGKSKDEKYWYKKGLALYSSMEYKTAIECFNKALEIDPDFKTAKIYKRHALRLLTKAIEH